MATKFGVKQRNAPTPAWVVKAVVVITAICQAVPMAVTASPVVNQPTKDLIHLIFSIANIVLTSLATLFGATDNQ